MENAVAAKAGCDQRGTRTPTQHACTLTQPSAKMFGRLPQDKVAKITPNRSNRQNPPVFRHGSRFLTLQYLGLLVEFSKLHT
jgi:hypothetical protein